MYFFKKTEKNWSQRKDTLHEERKVLADKLKDGMMSISQMKKGTDGIMSHTEQVVKYDKWKDINKQDIEKWHGINREFKKQGDEGRIHTLDDLRENKMKFD